LSFISEHSIPDTHPSLNGHFPGNPIVPGVVLLEEVLTALKEWLPGCHVKGFQTVKFLHPVKPNSNFTIDFNQTSPGLIKFMCHSDQLLLNTGTVILRSAQHTS
jgi:3-hydroxyacyl-[acyl-carrier-protein] dehydratase